MRGGFASLLDDQTVGEALEMVRSNPPEGRIIYFYVLDRDGRFAELCPRGVCCSIRPINAYG